MSEFIGNTQAWGLILGVLAPMLISVVQQPKFTGTVRAVVAVAASAVIGLLTVLAAGDFAVGEWLTTAALVLVASHTAYEGFYKPTGVAKAIEEGTSPGA